MLCQGLQQDASAERTRREQDTKITMDPINTLPAIVETIRAELTGMSTLRDATLARSRTLIRSCATEHPRHPPP
jgi:hypothetical protein